VTFYTPQDAMDWLHGKVNDLFAARGILQDLYGRALLAQQKAMGTTNAVRATQLVADLTTSLDDQSTLEQRVKAVVPSSWLPQTMGFVPLIIGLGVIAVAGAVYLHLQRVAEHQHTLALVESGVLTPAQAIQLESSGGLLGGGGLSGLTDNLKYILLAGAGLYALTLFGPMLSRMVGGRRS
jgi:hypothetical protein